MDRRAITDYLLSMLSWAGIEGETNVLSEALRRWASMPRLGFVDAHLGAKADADACPVFTKNVVDFVSQGVPAPEPLPDST
jgi:hypothetical protein